MRKTHQNLSETHIVGDQTREWLVRADQASPLRLQQIMHVGVAAARPPYEMVRTHLNGTYFLGCFGGEGRILLDGRWRVCRTGMACLAPPHVLHAFHAIPGAHWEFCWVKYAQPAQQKPIVTSISPVMARFDCQALKCAIMGLYHEVNGMKDPAVLKHWVDLIHGYVLRFAQPWHLDERLTRLWNHVQSNLGEEWSMDRLSAFVHMSGEHLRRLCQKQLGRSPMHHLTYLRMERAAEMLEIGPAKIESIANELGYQNPFVFSNTFKRWIGWRPSDYRKRKTPG